MQHPTTTLISSRSTRLSPPRSTTCKSGNQEWYMDSGASSHMASNPGILSTYTPSNAHTITVGNGASLPISHIGSHTLPSRSRPRYLNHLLIVPHIIKNILSVRQLTTDNYVYIEFDPWGFSVKDLRTGAVILRCSSSGDLYPVTSLPHALITVTADSTLWHRRLGHPGADAFRRLVSSSSLPINKVLKDSSLCHACQLGRHVRLPFYPST